MIGYSILNQETLRLSSIFLTQIDSYIMAFRYSKVNDDVEMRTTACNISTLYYI